MKKFFHIISKNASVVFGSVFELFKWREFKDILAICGAAGGIAFIIYFLTGHEFALSGQVFLLTFLAMFAEIILMCLLASPFLFVVFVMRDCISELFRL